MIDHTSDDTRKSDFDPQHTTTTTTHTRAPKKKGNMVSPQAQVQAEKSLRQFIWQALDFDMLQSAEFTAERLVAMNKSNHGSVHLLALVLYRQAKYKAAANLTSEHPDHVGCAFLHAQCCLKLKLYTQGIDMLEHCREAWKNNRPSNPSGDFERNVDPDNVVVEALLGELYKASGAKQDAVKSFATCIKTNPFLWGPVKSMAEMGINLQSKNIYKRAFLDNKVDEDDPFANPSMPSSSSSVASSRPLLFKTSQNFLKSNTGSRSDVFGTPGPASIETDVLGTPSDGSKSRSMQPLAPQKRSARSFNNNERQAFAEPNPPPPANRRQMRPTTTAKRLATQAAQVSKTTNSSTSASSAASSSSSSSATANAARGGAKKDKVDTNQDAAIKEGEEYVCDVYRRITSAYVYCCKYECDKALKQFEYLPSEQRDSPFVLSKIGRLHFEKVSYSEAERVFQRLRALDPCRMEEMDIYSTLLWHLRSDVELGFLAHELVDIDRQSPQAWCALGNSFSLQREADQALKCFKRASQLDPDAPYPYTLQAHEHIANDAYENAQECFRLAIRADNRHYNAWYGLGFVFLRLSKLDLAELHFSRASAINPFNVVLICCMGMVLEKRGRYGDALEQFKRACDLQPKSALSRYKKARALLQLKLYNAALIEFDQLKNLAPNEASVHFLLGQLYKVLQSRDLAIKHFTIALNLDPKGAHLIKESLESLHAETE